jgi:hypothetical protein
MNLTHKETNTIFTLYELEKLREYFPDLIPVRDGVVKEHQKVWWRSEEGPQHISVLEGCHRSNIKEFPELYSLQEPKFRIITLYQYED